MAGSGSGPPVAAAPCKNSSRDQTRLSLSSSRFPRTLAGATTPGGEDTMVPCDCWVVGLITLWVLLDRRSALHLENLQLILSYDQTFRYLGLLQQMVDPRSWSTGLVALIDRRIDRWSMSSVDVTPTILHLNKKVTASTDRFYHRSTIDWSDRNYRSTSTNQF